MYKDENFCWAAVIKSQTRLYRYEGWPELMAEFHQFLQGLLKFNDKESFMQTEWDLQSQCVQAESHVHNI